MSYVFAEAYQKFAPRWFKVIRWREFAQRTVVCQKFMCYTVYGPLLMYWFNCSDPYPRELCIQQPQTEEERMEIKNQCIKNNYIKNWGIDQYSNQYPPQQDVFKRRQKYPEHYGDKYNNYKMDNVR